MSVIREPDPDDPINAARGCFNALVLSVLLVALGYVLWRIFT